MNRRFSPESLAVLSGLLLTLSFPPFDMFFAAWVAWLPLWAALQQIGWQRGFKLGYITGFVFTLTSLNWIANNSGTSFLIAASSMMGTVAYLSLWFGLFGLIIARAGRNLGTKGLWLAPIFWVSIEFIYSYHGYTLAFPWLSLAMTQNFALPIQQLAEYGGIYHLDMEFASTSYSGQVRLYLDGQVLTTISETPITGEWNLFAEALVEGLDISVGEHELKLQILEDGFNMRALVFTLDSAYTSPETPGSFSLGQNYPNPFNGGTRIPVSTLTDGPLIIEILDMSGSRVNTFTIDKHSSDDFLEWHGMDV